MPANTGDTKDLQLIPGTGRSPGVGNGNPHQNSCLRNPMDRETWQATVHGVPKNRTRPSEHKKCTVYLCTGTFWRDTNHCVSLLCPQEPIFTALGSISLLLTMLSLKVKVLVAQSCPTPCDPMDCSLQGSSVHGILQARIQEWVAMPFFRGICLTQGSNLSVLHLR